VKVSGDVQACAGTHCRSTGEIGPIKIIRVEHIQDGIERLEFAAGTAAIYYMQQIEQILASAAAILSVQRENLPQTVERFFTEWKEQKKEIERLRAKLVELEMNQVSGEMIGGIPVTVRTIDASPKELVALATGIANRGGIALIAGGNERVHVVVASGVSTVHAGDVVQKVCAILGGKGGGKPGLAQGGGPEKDRLEEALGAGRDMIVALING
jgi:alanyl-tRNA synthetase